jgi:hypothetical protein
MSSSALITYPAGDTDVTVQIEVGKQGLLFSGKTMHHNVGQLIPIRFEDLIEAWIGITFMQEQWHV